MKNLTIVFVIIAVLAIGVGAYFLMQSPAGNVAVNKGPVATPTPVPSATVAPTEQKPVDKSVSVLGKSVEGRDITAYHFGEGATELLFIGGIHGGYEWNTVLLAYELMDHLKKNPSAVAKNLKVTVIPVMNPDGLYKVTGSAGRFVPADVSQSQTKVVSGRFNANNVDLSRNFDCQWQASGAWQAKTVSGGSAPFSEPESQAIRKYILEHKPAANVTWYSAAGGVFLSNCTAGISAETRTIANKYSASSGYPQYDTFDFYPLSGDMVNWFAKENIPAISVLLTDHTSTEWNKNLAGFEALLKYYAR
ncbi:MAG: M14 family metallopeptidase [bacterium]|nr:M14 family metallopeptidase [bacterium]